MCVSNRISTVEGARGKKDAGKCKGILTRKQSGEGAGAGTGRHIAVGRTAEGDRRRLVVVAGGSIRPDHQEALFVE